MGGEVPERNHPRVVERMVPGSGALEMFDAGVDVLNELVVGQRRNVRSREFERPSHEHWLYFIVPPAHILPPESVREDPRGRSDQTSDIVRLESLSERCPCARLVARGPRDQHSGLAKHESVDVPGLGPPSETAVALR